MPRKSTIKELHVYGPYLTLARVDTDLWGNPVWLCAKEGNEPNQWVAVSTNTLRYYTTPTYFYTRYPAPVIEGDVYGDFHVLRYLHTDIQLHRWFEVKCVYCGKKFEWMTGTIRDCMEHRACTKKKADQS